jgi:hypothetical protein
LHLAESAAIPSICFSVQAKKSNNSAESRDRQAMSDREDTTHRIIKRSSVTRRHLHVVPPLPQSSTQSRTIGQLIARTALLADGTATGSVPTPPVDAPPKQRRTGRWGWPL